MTSPALFIDQTVYGLVEGDLEALNILNERIQQSQDVNTQKYTVPNHITIFIFILFIFLF